VRGGLSVLDRIVIYSMASRAQGVRGSATSASSSNSQLVAALACHRLVTIARLPPDVVLRTPLSRRALRIEPFKRSDNTRPGWRPRTATQPGPQRRDSCLPSQ
jgi:hypothetical protein